MTYQYNGFSTIYNVTLIIWFDYQSIFPDSIDSKINILFNVRLSPFALDSIPRVPQERVNSGMNAVLHISFQYNRSSLQ